MTRPRKLSQSEQFLLREARSRGQYKLEARLRGLSHFAVHIFHDRNAWDMPAATRAAQKAEARPFFREAIRWAKRSRDALLFRDIEMHELLRDRARMYFLAAKLEFFQPYANKEGRRGLSLVTIAPRGGQARALKSETRRSMEFGDINQLERKIQAALDRDDVRGRAKGWASEYGLSLSKTYEIIKQTRANRKL